MSLPRLVSWEALPYKPPVKLLENIEESTWQMNQNQAIALSVEPEISAQFNRRHTPCLCII